MWPADYITSYTDSVSRACRSEAMRSVMRFCKIFIAREPIIYGLLSLPAF